MKPGRFSFSVPRPYSVHAPSDGRGDWKMPVCICRNACGWVGRSVCMLLTHAQLVGVLGQLGEQLGDPQAALAVLAETPRRAQQLGRWARGPADRLAVVGGQLRLVVEGIDVRRPALHAQEDDALRPRREVRLLRRQRDRALLRRPGREAGEGEVAEAGGGRFQRGATRKATGRDFVIMTAPIRSVAVEELRTGEQRLAQRRPPVPRLAAWRRSSPRNQRSRIRDQEVLGRLPSPWPWRAAEDRDR